MGSATPLRDTGSRRRRVAGARLPLATLAAGLIGLAILLTGCGGADSTSSSTSSGAVQAVTIQDYMFKPGKITVPAGTTIKFTNEDGTPHTATSKEPGAFETGPIKTGKSGEITLEKTGTFAYYCVFHPFMKGAITGE